MKRKTLIKPSQRHLQRFMACEAGKKTYLNMVIVHINHVDTSKRNKIIKEITENNQFYPFQDRLTPVLIGRKINLLRDV